jgi:hypothetical protein
VTGLRVSPDGHRYLVMHQRRVCRPFHLRWLLPMVLRGNPLAWLWVSRLSLVAVGLLTWAYTDSVWMVCVAALPGLHFNWRFPVLVDVTAMALALAAAVMLPIFWPAAILLVLLAGCTKESSPVFAALYAFNPVLLVGLIPVAIRWLQRQGPDVDTLPADNHLLVSHPFKAGWDFHSKRLLDPQLMLLPWGGLIVALGAVNVQLVAVLVAAYGQLVVATDSVRLYQWAAPVVALAAVEAIPAQWLPLVAAVTVFNPFKGDGV